MQYVDAVFGSTSFTGPMILDLLQSDAIERFEHSVGAMILAQRAGGASGHDFTSLDRLSWRGVPDSRLLFARRASPVPVKFPLERDRLLGQ